MKVSLSTALVFWLVLLALQLVAIQYLEWLIRWRSEAFGKLKNRYSVRFGIPFSPNIMLMTGTLIFWIPSLILLRIHSAEAWEVPSYAIVGIPLILALPCYLIGKSVAAIPRIRTRLTNSDQVKWTYSLGGVFLATGSVVLPVFIYLISGVEEMLSDLCVSMAFVSGTVLPCVLGFIKGFAKNDE